MNRKRAVAIRAAILAAVVLAFVSSRSIDDTPESWYAMRYIPAGFFQAELDTQMLRCHRLANMRFNAELRRNKSQRLAYDVSQMNVPYDVYKQLALNDLPVRSDMGIQAMRAIARSAATATVDSVRKYEVAIDKILVARRTGHMAKPVRVQSRDDVMNMGWRSFGIFDDYDSYVVYVEPKRTARFLIPVFAATLGAAATFALVYALPIVALTLGKAFAWFFGGPFRRGGR